VSLGPEDQRLYKEPCQNEGIIYSLQWMNSDSQSDSSKHQNGTCFTSEKQDLPSNLYLHKTLIYLGTSAFIHLSMNPEKFWVSAETVCFSSPLYENRACPKDRRLPAALPPENRRDDSPRLSPQQPRSKRHHCLQSCSMTRTTGQSPR